MTASQAHKFFTGRAAEEEARLRENQGSRSSAFFKAAYDRYADDALGQMVLEKAEANGEVVEMRLIGPRADRGSLPIKLFVDFLDPMQKSLAYAGHVARYGTEDRKIDPSVREDMDLRVAGLGSGSTRIYLSGSSTKDTTGTSLLNTVVGNVFDVLNAGGEKFDYAVDAIGPRALKSLGASLKKLELSDLAAQFSWSKDGKLTTWDGSPWEIKRVIDLIQAHSPPEKFEQVLSGVVVAITDRGRLEIMHGGERFKIRYALKDHRLVKGLKFSESVTIRVSTSKVINDVTRQELETHLLKSIVS